MIEPEDIATFAPDNEEISRVVPEIYKQITEDAILEAEKQGIAHDLDV